MEVYSLDSKVKVGQFEGIITAIHIAKGILKYEVSYWQNQDYKEVWFYEQFVELITGNRMKIGFK